MKRLALLAFFLVAACGSVGVVEAHSISLAYKAGDVYKYKFQMALKYTIGGEGMSIPLDISLGAKETMTVKSVDSRGMADVSVIVSDASLKMTVNGTTNTTTTPTSIVDMKITPDGRIVSIDGSAFGNSSPLGMTGYQVGLVTAILPDTPVKPGDSWTKTYDQPNPFGPGSSSATTNSKYLRDEKVGSVNTAVVESKVTANLTISIDASSVSGQSGTSVFPSMGGSGGLQSITITGRSVSDVTSWIDANARRVVKTHSSGTVDATMAINMAAGSTTPGLSGPITFKGTQTLDMTPV
jgi:hypothetical protein